MEKCMHSFLFLKERVISKKHGFKLLIANVKFRGKTQQIAPPKKNNPKPFHYCYSSTSK